MGKVRRQRNKMHLEAKSKPQETIKEVSTDGGPKMLIEPSANLFEGLNINVDSLKKLDDVRSVKSHRSSKSEATKVLSKKDKLVLRRQMLLKKFEAMNEQKLLMKRKKQTVVGDLNPLRDALPSLESLLKNKVNVPYKRQEAKKNRGIQKAKVLRKKHVQGVKLFQQILKDKQFQKNPRQLISQNVTAILQQEKRK